MPRKKGRENPADAHACFTYNLERLLEYKGWSHKELADKIDPPVARATISEIVKGRGCPTLNTVDKIAKAFKLPAYLFLDDQMEESMKKLLRRNKDMRKEYEYPAKKMEVQKTILKYNLRKP